MSLESATHINDLVTTNPVSADNVAQGDDHIRMMKAVLKTDFPNATKPFRFPSASEKTATGAIASTDDNSIIVCNGSGGAITLMLPSLGADDEGWSVLFYQAHATNFTTIEPPAGTISGAADYELDYQYATVTISWTGSVFIYEQDAVARAQKNRLDNITANRLLGRYDTAGAFQEITVGAGLSLGAGPTLTADTVLPRGYIDGMIFSNNSSDATNDIDCTAGVCRDSTNGFNISVAAATKQLDANWVAGTSGGVRNSAAGLTDTTYHFYAARTAASATGSLYAHTSLDKSTVLTALQAETGGASYVYLQYVYSIIRASGSIVGFIHEGNTTWLKTWERFEDTNAHNGSRATATFTAVPNGLEVEAILAVGMSSGTANHAVLWSSLNISDPGSPDGTASGAAPGCSVVINATGRAWVDNVRIQTNVSRGVGYRSNNAAVLSFAMLKGWVHRRCRDAA